MPAVNCKYHTSTPARWNCGQCHISYCPSCVIEKETGHVPDCPVCKRGLDSLGAENLITPFWLRLREFFIFPVHPSPFLLILVMTLFAMLVRYVPGWDIDIKLITFEIPRNAILVFPFIIVFLKYAQTVLEDTAQGYLRPKPLSSNSLFGNSIIVFKLLAILLTFKLLTSAALDMFDQTGYYFANILTSIGTPAAIMILAMEHRFSSAMNPVMIYSVISRIGMPYFIMFVMFYLLDIAQSFLLALLQQYIDPSLSFAVYVFVTLYFYIIIFNMMGYIIYQHHEVLGFRIDVEMHQQDEDTQFNSVAVSPEMREIEILVHEGKMAQAVTQLRTLIDTNPGNIDAHERILKLLRLVGDKPIHFKQAQKFMSYLIGKNKMGSAAQILQQGYEFDKKLKPEKAVERHDMAKYLRQKGKAKLAMVVVNDLHREYPSYEGIPEAYLMVAQLLSEHLNDDDRAIMILQFLIKNYGTHSLIGEVEEYLRTIQRISHH
ncbi:hypothetical protein MNBD_GAMMA21-1003 [hydrothermal vent metagenome]|uniref:B box-type domain-containing protein n=1 Tax=hydrothermal vent metagenome TaxID=652676 RepID=A0A3B1A8G0_9ZZZZ